MMKKSTLLLAVLVAGLFSGCSSSRNYVTVHESTKITKGRELVDLQRALDEGAINAQEFEKLRRAVMRRPN